MGDIPNKIIKAIRHEDKLYALDVKGNVGINHGGLGVTFNQVMTQCTDILLTDSLLAKQHSADQ